MTTDKSSDSRSSAADGKDDSRPSGGNGDSNVANSSNQSGNDAGSRSRTVSPLNIPRPDSIPNTTTPPPTVSSAPNDPSGSTSGNAPSNAGNAQESRKRRLQAAVAAQAASEDASTGQSDSSDPQPSAKVMKISPPSSSLGSPATSSGKDEESESRVQDGKEKPEDAKKVPPIKIVLPGAGSVSSSAEGCSDVPTSTTSSKSPPVQGSSTQPPTTSAGGIAGGLKFGSVSSNPTTMPTGIRLPYVMLGPAVVTMPPSSTTFSAPTSTSGSLLSPSPSSTAVGIVAGKVGAGSNQGTTVPGSSVDVKGQNPDVPESPAGSRPPSVSPADSPARADKGQSGVAQDEAKGSPKPNSDAGEPAPLPASRPPSTGTGSNRQQHETKDVKSPDILADVKCGSAKTSPLGPARSSQSPKATHDLENAGSPALTIGVDAPEKDTDAEASVGIDPGDASRAARADAKSPGEKRDDPAGTSNKCEDMDVDEAAADISADDQAVDEDPLKIDPENEGTRTDGTSGDDNGEASAEGRDEEQQEESKPNNTVEHPRKRKLKLAQVASAAVVSPVVYPSPTAVFRIEEQSFSNPLDVFFKVKRHLEVQRRQLTPTYPKAPQGYEDYLMHRGTYVLHGNPQAQMAAGSHLPPPPGLMGIPGLRDLFVSQEQERAKLRLKHLVEKEKLVLCVEQEILRVHGKAHRIVQNQCLPASACVMLRDAVLSNPPPPGRDAWQNPYQMICYPSNEDSGNSRDSRSCPPQPNGSAAAAAARSRYNGRLFLSWLQDVDDKWEKIKSGMVLRHHNEAEALQAVQKMEWEFKLQELGMVPNKDSSAASASLAVKIAKSPKTWHPVEVAVDDVNIPIVHVSDDFDLLPA